MTDHKNEPLPPGDLLTGSTDKGRRDCAPLLDRLDKVASDMKQLEWKLLRKSRSAGASGGGDIVTDGK